MSKKTALMLSMTLLVGILCAASRIQGARAAATVYIRPDGAIEPPAAQISTADNLTYIFTGDLNGSLIVERSSIVIDGRRYTLYGEGLADSVGMKLDRVANVTVVDIEVNAFHWGICLNASSNNTLFMCTVSSSSVGMRIDTNSTGNRIEANEIKDCTSGLESGQQCDLNLFCDNRIVRCAESGARLEQSSNCTFVGNLFANNNCSVEIVSAQSENNTFSHNTFLFATAHVYFHEQAHNFWDNGYPVGGNFWDDYDGADQQSGPSQTESGNDGIGDNPYLVDADNQHADNYPLIGIFIRVLDVSVDDDVAQFIGYSANSTITSFSYDSQSNTMTLNTTIDEQTFGFCKAVISKNFLSLPLQDLTVKVNGQRVPFKLKESPTHASLCFTYQHSLAEEPASIPIFYLLGVLIILVAFFFMIMRLKKISGISADKEEEQKNSR